MHKFVRDLITEWRRLEVPMVGNLIVGVSGGADSLALLHAMCELHGRGKFGFALTAAHFDHGLRGKESTADSEFVRDMAGSLGIAFVSGSGEIKKHGNLEQNARLARYKFLLETAQMANAFAVITGHTLNDQAETFLLNLIRGSGADGLSAMPPVRPLDPTGGSPLLVRPMLRWAKREDTEGFCRDLGLEPRHDAMNDDTAFTRVRIRKTVLPLLRELNPRIIETLAATSALMAGERSSTSVPKIDGTGETLTLADLRKMEHQELYRFLRKWVKDRRGGLRGIDMKHIESIERLISSRKSGRAVELPGGQTVIKNGGKLVFVHIKVEN